MKNIIRIGVTLTLVVCPLFMAFQTMMDYPTQVRRTPTVDPRAYTFSRSIGGLTIGNNTVSMNCPAGLGPADVRHWVYIGGSGTPEPALITGGSGAAGSSCSLSFTTVNAHSGTSTMTSATGGAQEALNSSTTGVTVALPYGATVIHAPIYTPSTGTTSLSAGLSRWSFGGQANMGSSLVMASDYPLTATGMVTMANGFAGTISNLQFVFPAQPDSPTYSAYTHFPPAIDGSLGASYGNVHDVDTIGAWVSVQCSATCSGFSFHNMHVSGYSQGLNFGNSAGDFVRISDIYYGPNIAGTTNNSNVHLANGVGFVASDGFIQITNFQGFGLATVFSISGGRINIVNPGCDAAMCLAVSGGRVTMKGGYATAGGASNYLLLQSGGEVLVSGLIAERVLTTALPFVSISGPSVTNLSAIQFDSGPNDVPAISSTAANSVLTVANCYYNNQFVNSAGPFLNLNAGNISLTAIGNILPGTTNAAAKFVNLNSLASGTWNITGNQMFGWGIDPPSPVNASSQAVIANNNGMDDQILTIASASSVTLPAGRSRVVLTGTTQVNALNGGSSGRTVTILTASAILFPASATVAASFTSTPNIPIIATFMNGAFYLR